MMAPVFQKGAKFSSGSDEGRWLVWRKLGEGQFAEVYEVKDTLVRDRDARVSDAGQVVTRSYNVVVHA